ncbi:MULTISPECIES: head-tail adaptor protein [unclassified Enterococcus]|uniref:head-tail adaptor protein n=1 Tax=unclassified Enterococcus TaxID=2608891 RepID=UPI0013ED55D1|nr:MULTISPECIES: head-tail adaptor protein [unclassified Enterococcus]
MYRTQRFRIQQLSEQIPDHIGGLSDSWEEYAVIDGYLDFLSGDDGQLMQNAFVEESTHIVVTTEYTAGITNAMKLIDEENRWYEITLADDPLNLHHHNELYLKFSGDRYEK